MEEQRNQEIKGLGAVLEVMALQERFLEERFGA